MRKHPWKKWLSYSLVTACLIGIVPEAGAQTSTYTVQRGDMLYIISQRYGTTVDQLKAANSLTTDEIRLGQVLTIPVTSGQPNYTVQTGDTLYLISTKFNTTIDAIMTANKLSTTSLLVGQKLIIPATTTGSTSENTVNTQTGTSTGNQTYVVKSGDVLWKIAQTYGTTIEAISKANNLTNYYITVGQVLIIPTSASSSTTGSTSPALASPVTYTVKSGDMLWKIAQSYGTTVDAIVQLNTLTSHYIQVGQVLNIPTSGQASNPTTPAPDTQPVDPPSTEEAGGTEPPTSGIEQPAPSQPSTNDNEVISPQTGPWVEYQTYTVQKGETGWTISLKFGIPFSEFLQLNNMTESSTLAIGQQVKVAVHHVPVKPAATPSAGELLDWWTEAQYIFPIGTVAKVTDVKTGKTWNIKRTIGASHADCEPVTSADSETMKAVWGGNYSWAVRPVILEINDRRIAASVSSMPHSIEYITDNNFTGHFDVHFLNSLRHKDNLIDPDHQAAVKIAAGLASLQ